VKTIIEIYYIMKIKWREREEEESGDGGGEGGGGLFGCNYH
jgi:hypothetical protein